MTSFQNATAAVNKLTEKDWVRIFQILHGNGLERVRQQLLYAAWPDVFSTMPGAIEEVFARAQSLRPHITIPHQHTPEVDGTRPPPTKNPPTPSVKPYHTPIETTPPLPPKIERTIEPASIQPAPAPASPPPVPAQPPIEKNRAVVTIDGKDYVRTSVAMTILGANMGNSNYILNGGNPARIKASRIKHPGDDRVLLYLLSDIDAIDASRRGGRKITEGRKSAGVASEEVAAMFEPGVHLPPPKVTIREKDHASHPKQVKPWPSDMKFKDDAADA